MNGRDTVLVHLRLDPTLVQALDMFAAAWGTHRAAAASRLLEAGMRHEWDAVTAMVERVMGQHAPTGG